MTVPLFGLTQEKRRNKEEREKVRWKQTLIVKCHTWTETIFPKSKYGIVCIPDD